MSTNTSSAENTVYAATPWADYNAFRPLYPPSVFDLILSQHTQNSGSFNAAHDVGAGSGQAASVLARCFKNIYVSDIAEHNVQTAKQLLTSKAFQQSLPRQCNIFAAVRGGEVGPEDGFVGERALDLVTVFEALHWMDPERAVKAAADSLRSEGLFAGLYYPRTPYITALGATGEEEKIAEEADKLWQLLDQTLSERMLANLPNKAATHRAGALANAGLDAIAFPETEWQKGVRRLYLNYRPQDKQRNYWWIDAVETTAPSRVQDDDRIEYLDNERDWSKVADGKWFGGYMRTLFPSVGGKTFEFAEKELEILGRLEDLVGRVEGGEVRVTWPVHLVLATRF